MQYLEFRITNVSFYFWYFQVWNPVVGFGTLVDVASVGAVFTFGTHDLHVH
jgi:hypothetical protein